MKCAIICLMTLYAFQTVFADLNSDFFQQVRFLTYVVERDIDDRVAAVSGMKINFGDCKDIAMVALQDAVFQKQKEEQTCMDNKKQKDKTACPRKAISDLRKDLKPIGPNLQACINLCAKTKNCDDD